ncbi:MAG: bifunctional 5,10-methylenetetrahydrofolate dehydrogenase/5,10-methenyltetrahydrofolate cyclohydrolase [Deltaproteobacteria bacterium]|jgi:methylenetetrahydrofolate dehydrogenase (NADP+)/methenyltetrahydrofolate cyclohydrolase|nr:bifunctional 5,10-methylenetetrahydrofolate dehydrogenase/5,10-methenyltetrahydrofolate cyclohydrolase [Deltaproteobacteria bacterium]
MLASKPIVQKLKAEIREEAERRARGGAPPGLAVILAGSDGPSKAYALSKESAARSLGIAFTLHRFGDGAEEAEITARIRELNSDPAVHGVMLELPLPKRLNAARVIAAIDPDKDVDGVTAESRGRLLQGRLDETLLPVTPLSCLTLIESAGIDIAGKNVAVVGRGETVGLPLAVLLIKRSATVTVCHSKTADLKGVLKRSDVVVTAAGQAGMIKADMLSQGQAVIDAGITVLPDGTLAGDVEKRAAEAVSWLTPVPGGVGSLTVTLLMKNLLKAMGLQGAGRAA